MKQADEICGAMPRRGSWTVWCVLAPRHAGLHEGKDDDGRLIHFSQRRPRGRVTASGSFVADKPARRGSR